MNFKKLVFHALGVTALVLTGTAGPASARAWRNAALQSQAAAGAEKPKPGLSLQPARKIEFDTDEGTWLSLDVSPDGKTIIFDMLGQLWTIPIAGGKATRLTTGMAFNTQPRYSPDGKWIAFLTDRSGADNVWISKPDGSDARQLSKDEQSEFASPTWTPDSQYVIVSRATEGLGAYELWMYDIRGGSGVALTHAKAHPDTPRNMQDNAMGPVVSPDGRYVYFAHKRGGFQYNILDFPLWQVQRLDRQTGAVDTLTNEAGSAFRPWLSPDGGKLIYGTRYERDSALRIRDLKTGDDRWFKYPVQRDDQESRFVSDLLPGYAFTPDGQSVVLYNGGKFHRVDVATGKDAPIPFTAHVSLDLGPKLYFPARVNEGPVKVRLIQGPVQSPDGRRLAFSALAHLYVVDLPAGSPERVAAGEQRQFEPAWSPDSQWIAYVTWDSEEHGALWKVRADGTGAPQRLSDADAFYSDPAWSPDGTRIVALRAPDILRDYRSPGAGQPAATDLVWFSAGGGDAHSIIPALGASKPHFTKDPTRIFLSSPQGLISVRYDGTDRRTYVKITGNPRGEQPSPARDIRMSPDETMALAAVNYQLYLVAVPAVGGEAPTVNVEKPSVGVKKLTEVGADYFDWADGGKTITWGLGASFFREPVSAVTFQDPDKPQAATAYQETPVTIEAQRYIARGSVVLRGAKVITMHGDDVLPDADLVVTDNRIAGVGKRGAVAIPAGAKIIDVRGMTIMPGMIDVHAHWLEIRRGVMDPESWPFLANLAYGVTTGRDPQSFSNDIFAYHDMVETGQMIGPRLYSTGPGVFSDNDFKSLEQTRGVVEKYARYYRTKTLKSYMVGNRQQRQWMVEACKALGIMPTTEGGLDMKLNLTHMIDGFSGNEHSIPIVPLYNDVVQLAAQSGIFYTPTLIVAYGGPWAENYFYETTDVHGDPKLNRFIPHEVLDARAKRRPWFLPQEQVFPRLAAQDTKILRAGGKIQIGCHGQLQGIGCDWELWAIASGGMTNMEALRVATLDGAEAIGYAQDLGSIEPGKLADLLVLRKDPLADIHNTNTIRYVMKGGEMFDGDTLDEVWPEQKKLEPLPWRNDRPQP
ncbi:MAG TPA: amidohydrolase family protein [Candidatus Acidoferrales bacterium]|nr:amidohydrolase family protein [Candidatus Acidoferrales bacterium]